MRDIEKIKSVTAIFTSIASFLRFFEFFMALFQGISYWLETLQAGQAERGFCLACLRISNFRENFPTPGKPGRRMFLPGLPGEFLANKKCLEKVPQKFLNISEVKHWRWKWQLQTWFFQSPPQGRLLFQILTFLGSNPFWLFWHHLNTDMETPWWPHYFLHSQPLLRM